MSGMIGYIAGILTYPALLLLLVLWGHWIRWWRCYVGLSISLKVFDAEQSERQYVPQTWNLRTVPHTAGLVHVGQWKPRFWESDNTSRWVSLGRRGPGRRGDGVSWGVSLHYWKQAQ